MTKIFAIMCFVVLAAFPASAQQYDRLVQIVVDDTGTLQDEQDAARRTARETLFRYLQSVASEYGRNDQIVIISQNSAGNVWVGSPRDITRARSNQGLQSFLQTPLRGCSDLPPIFRILADNTIAYDAREHEVVFFSSLIHTGRPCSLGTRLPTDIGLPQEFISGLDEFVVEYQPEMSFYWVFDALDAQLRENLFDFMRDRGLSFVIKVEAETRSERF